LCYCGLLYFCVTVVCYICFVCLWFAIYFVLLRFTINIVLLLCFVILSTIADETFMLNNIDYILSRFIIILLFHLQSNKIVLHRDFLQYFV